tara:strand:+ start:193 stop:1788 length:1596 start_codon:yes stop_codon:yes gene_type:complete
MVKSIKEYALAYKKKFGWNVFPVGKDKKPLFSWKHLQKEKVTEDMIKEWWTKYPDANIGCVTGTVSNLAVIDIDTEEGKNEIQQYLPAEAYFPISQTPKGGNHLFFSCKDTKLTNNAGVVKGCDFRANGGYVLLPPSTNGNGKPYKWQIRPSELKEGLEALPIPYIKYIYNIYKEEGVTQRNKALRDVTEMFKDGGRDEDMFHVANCLVRGGMEKERVGKVLYNLALTCKPAFPEKEVMVKINSAIERTEKREHQWKFEVEEWIALQRGYWKVAECNMALQAVTREEKSAVRVTIQRFVKDGLIQHHSSQAGTYRLVDKECEELDYINATDEVVDIKYPFEIERYSITYPKSIILVAGEPNAGKSAFMLNMVEMNMFKHKVNYLSSEMGAQMLRSRLKKFDRPLDSWKFAPKLRAENFADVIEPEGLNIIDYMEIHENHYLIGKWLKEVFDKLTTGIAVIAIQREGGKTHGRGGMTTLEKPQLVVNIGGGEAEIIKCKSHAMEGVNPNGMKLDFSLIQGCKFETKISWRKE